MFGNAEHRWHPGPPGRLDHCLDWFRVDGHRSFWMTAGVDGASERELGEHCDVAALDASLVKHGHVPRQIQVDVPWSSVVGD